MESLSEFNFRGLQTYAYPIQIGIILTTEEKKSCVKISKIVNTAVLTFKIPGNSLGTSGKCLALTEFVIKFSKFADVFCIKVLILESFYVFAEGLLANYLNSSAEKKKYDLDIFLNKNDTIITVFLYLLTL
jgi:hypothetical protein